MSFTSINFPRIAVQTRKKVENIINTITDISGHYTFNNDNVKKEIENLFENLAEAGVNAEEYVIYKLKESLDRYVECFNLKGYTSRLKK